MNLKNLILDYEDYKNEANSNNVYEYYFNFTDYTYGDVYQKRFKVNQSR